MSFGGTMGKTFKQLKTENRILKRKLDLLTKIGTVTSIKAGDLVTIKTNELFQGVAFGISAVRELETMLSDMAGGKVVVVATQKNYDLDTIRGSALHQLQDAITKLIGKRE